METPVSTRPRLPGHPSHRRWLLFLSLALASPAAAVDLSGSARISTGTTRDDRGSSETLEQLYTLELRQPLTPFLSLSLSHRHTQLDSTFPGLEDSRQRFRAPQLTLRYQRPQLWGQVGVSHRLTDGSAPSDALEVRSQLVHIGWRPSRGPSFNARWRSDANLVDPTVFGRDTDTSGMDLEAVYGRRFWGFSYAYRQSELESRDLDLRFERSSHEARLHGGRRFLDNGLGLTLGSWVRQVDRLQEIPVGTGLLEPIAPREGLFAVDTAPEVGELVPAPGLIDGDLVSPATPEAQIGGGNTFRNFGLDLGITRPVSALEVVVDAASGPLVAWQVYRSADNLVWELVPGAISSFQEPLLRYIIQFPVITERYVKAVNVSVNPAPRVAVTELRALAEAQDLESGQFRDTLYRADLGADARLHPRARVQVGLGISSEDGPGDGLVGREIRTSYANASLAVGLRSDLDLTLGHRYSDYESRGVAALLRTERQSSSSLRWRPLETVDATLTASRREELEGSDPLRATDRMGLAVVTELLPDLRLTSRVALTRIDELQLGQRREIFSLNETLQAQPAPNWRLGLGYLYTRYQGRGSDGLDFSRRGFDLSTQWLAAPHLHLSGSFGWLAWRDRRQRRQSYSVAWTPGSRLGVNVGYLESTSDELRSTRSTTAGATYRLSHQFQLFGDLNRSRFDEPGRVPQAVTSFRTGMTLFF
jgi:hypothetical protein